MRRTSPSILLLLTLSCAGPPGSPGPEGPPGREGPAGKDGETGDASDIEAITERLASDPAFRDDMISALANDAAFRRELAGVLVDRHGAELQGEAGPIGPRGEVGAQGPAGAAGSCDCEGQAEAVPTCWKSCQTAEDCVAPSALYGLENMACDAGICRWRGCLEDGECVEAIGAGQVCR